MSGNQSTSSAYTEWEQLVGKAIIRFGEIEIISLKCLAYFSRDRIGVSLAKLNFARRADILIELLQGRGNIGQDAQGLLEAFQRARTLAETRNLIAHNPVMLDLYVNQDSTESCADYSIASARSGSKTLDLAGLKEFSAEVDDLAATLWMHFARASGEIDSMWRTHNI